MQATSFVYLPPDSRVSTEMFKFSFDVDKTDNNFFAGEDLEQSSADVELPCEESVEIVCSEEHLQKVELYREHSDVLALNSFSILHLKETSLQELSVSREEGGIGKAENSHSDLIPGVYEGGAKIWECTGDLIAYLDNKCSAAMFEGKRVLDVGCGAGLLGVYALLSNASNVHFQDYNEEVLRDVTVPTVLLNCPHGSSETLMKKCQLFSGDWSKYVEKTKAQAKFDIILTAETIYNVANYPKLIRMIDEKLASNGVVFLAAKVYYFGVGGGLREFEKALEQRYAYETVWKSDIGVSREILRISQKN